MRAMPITSLAFAAMTCFVVMPRPVYCQPANSNPAEAHWEYPSKVENGLEIVWRNTSFPGNPNAADSDPEAKLEIFDAAVNKWAVCRVANAIRTTDPTFSGVSIYDVSARKPGFIAVAAVYARATGSPLASLLFFDWSGALTRKVVLDKLPQIESLEIDDAGHVWALNDLGDRGAKCLFTEFDPDGSVVRKLVKTRRRWSTDESASKGGQVSFGLTAGRVWTWLPSTRTLVSVDESKGKSMIRRTGLPSVGNNARIYAGKAELQADGRLVMEVLGDGDKGHFVWSAATGWKRD